MFITVDPERDNVPAIKAFVSAFHPRLVGLTGSPAAIAAVQKAYGIYSKKVATSDPQNYLVDHFAVIYLFGPDGAPIAFLPHGSTADDVTAMLQTYVR
jgi:protein SCO1/2